MNFLEVKRTKVKVTRPINAHTINAQYLSNGKAYKLQSSNFIHICVQRPISPTSDMTCKVKVARSRDASDRWWPISREQKVTETAKLVGRLATPRTVKHTSIQCQKVEVSRLINAHTVNVQSKREGLWTSIFVYRWIMKTKFTWSLWQLLAYKSRTKSPRKVKISRMVAHLTGNNAQQFQGQRSRSSLTRPISTEAESVSPVNFKRGKRLE